MLARGGRNPVGYAEVPEFHVQVARQADSSMAHRPVLVGGDPSKRGKVVSASVDLRKLGIVDGMGLAEALDRAPGACWVRTDVPRARELSGVLRAAVREEIEAVEVEGLAGFYMRAPRNRVEALDLAGRLEARVMERTGLLLRVGIAPARFAARLAAEDAGAFGSRVIGADDFESYLMGQPLDRLPGVGPKTAARLAEIGAVDVPGLRELGLERLEVLFGNHGRSLWLLACGEDPKPLRVKRHPDTLSREETLAGPIADRLGLVASVVRLAESLEGALRRDGLSAGRIAVQLTGMDGRTMTRSCTLMAPVGLAADLARAAQELLDRIDLEGRSVRRTGLVLKGLEIRGVEDRQLDLF